MSASALVLVPGLMCDSAIWRAQINHFGNSLDIHVADHGELNSLTTMAQKILDEAPATFALAGHSMGGRVALEVFRLAPERVTQLALLNTGCHALPEGEVAEKERTLRLGFLRLAQTQGVAAMARSWLRNMVHPSRLTDASLIDDIVSMFARKSVATYEAQIQALLNRPEQFPLLAAIRCPVLVLSGNEDLNSPPPVNHEMASSVPRAELSILADCGHMSLLERPEQVNQCLGQWLSRSN
jgi:hypothetical protein